MHADNGNTEQGGGEEKYLPSGNAIDQLKRKVFPKEWRTIPLKGKAPCTRGWQKSELNKKQCAELYHQTRGTTGLGVLTGELSGGLIALDIDGPEADARLKAYLDEVEPGAYEARGEESTMAWTSGKEGRRQVFWNVPNSMIPQLRDVTKVILKEDGTWELGSGDENRVKEGGGYQEVVLRFNRCQSVLPGSTRGEHDMTRYQWLSYNDGKVAPAPGWLSEILLQFAKPTGFLTDAEEQYLAEKYEHGYETDMPIPSNQLRGWFFKEQVQEKLIPRMRELVYNHAVFDEYGWIEGSGQFKSGCPFHHSVSGHAFHVSKAKGVWHCHACSVGGDVLDFMHKVKKGDAHAPRPMGRELEGYIADLAGKLGFNYPDDALPIQTTRNAAPTISPQKFFERLREIDQEMQNKEAARLEMLSFALQCNYKYRTGREVYESYRSYWLGHYKGFSGVLCAEELERIDKPEYIIPDFLRRPSSVMLHARGGLGKTKLALALARTIGKGLPMKIRGSQFMPRVRGKVLLIGTDMSRSQYIDYLAQQGIDILGKDKEWFLMCTEWEMEMELELIEMIRKHEPTMVIIDSISSASANSPYSEKEQGYSKTVYEMAKFNGFAFPATCFLWIHHNTKDGTTFRGTDTLRNAVDDTWELLSIPEEEQGEFPAGSKIMQIGKSRGMRDGARFLIREAIDEWITIDDLTGLEDRRGPGGDPTGPSLMRRVVKEEGPISRKDLLYKVNALVMGSGAVDAKPLQDRTIQRWLQKEIDMGTMEKVGTAETKGRPAPLYGWKGEEAKDTEMEEAVAVMGQIWGAGRPPENGTSLNTNSVSRSSENRSDPLQRSGFDFATTSRHSAVSGVISEGDVAKSEGASGLRDTVSGDFATRPAENGPKSADSGITLIPNQSGVAKGQEGQIPSSAGDVVGSDFATHQPGADIRESGGGIEALLEAEARALEALEAEENTSET